MLANFHGAVWAASILSAVSIAFLNQSAAPAGDGSARPSTSASHCSTPSRRYSVREPALIVLGQTSRIPRGFNLFQLANAAQLAKSPWHVLDRWCYGVSLNRFAGSPPCLRFCIR